MLENFKMKRLMALHNVLTLSKYKNVLRGFHSMHIYMWDTIKFKFIFLYRIFTIN